MKRSSTYLAATVVLGMGIWGVASVQMPFIGSAGAIELRDGKIYFVQPPRLMEATTTHNNTNMWGATYYFTLSLPENAGEPLARVTITQQQGEDNLRFRLEQSEAFEGTPQKEGSKLTLTAVTMDRQTQTISVTFDPPVEAGKTFTIGLQPVRNPQFDGIYLFAIAAFPPGEKAYGQFLGYGRLHFYSDGGLDSFF